MRTMLLLALVVGSMVACGRREATDDERLRRIVAEWRYSQMELEPILVRADGPDAERARDVKRIAEGYGELDRELRGTRWPSEWSADCQDLADEFGLQMGLALKIADDMGHRRIHAGGTLHRDLNQSESRTKDLIERLLARL